MPKQFQCAALMMLCATMVGCAAQRVNFRPTEGTRGMGAGHMGAYYDVRADGRTIGDVKVWSPGAYEVRRNGNVPTVHISLRIRNDGKQPIRFDPRGTELEIFTDEREMIVINQPTRVFGRLLVPAESIERVELYFRLPRGLRTGDIAGFELNWRLRTDDGMYTRSTPFIKEQPAMSRQMNPYGWRPAAYHYSWTNPWYPSPWWYW